MTYAIPLRLYGSLYCLVFIRERGFFFEGKARGAPKKRSVPGSVCIFRQLSNAAIGEKDRFRTGNV